MLDCHIAALQECPNFEFDGADNIGMVGMVIGKGEVDVFPISVQFSVQAMPQNYVIGLELNQLEVKQRLQVGASHKIILLYI